MNDILYPKRRRGSLHDQVFKGLIGKFLPDFLILVAPEPAGRLDLSHWKLLDKETFTDWPKGRRRELDLLAAVTLADLRRIATARVDGLSRLLLVNCVETYLQLEGRDAEELEMLQANEATGEVRTMRRMTWAEQLEAEWHEKGVEAGVKKGVAMGVEKGVERGVRQTLLRQLGLRFGPLSEEVRRQVEAIHSVERLNQIAEQILVARSLEELGLR